MAELLAPAGNMEALKAAIACGCDAVYLGMQKFGARAYSENFTNESLAEAVAYAHLRNVKVYVTVNTIVFEQELPAVYAQLDYLNSLGVDAVIVQDLAALRYVAEHFEDMEAHCSTQMGIDDVEGARLAKELGAKRVVVAREASIDTVRAIQQQAQIPVEVFIHGALCVSYSGNCIMSGMTGNRSGNRGRCIGSCRKLYSIFDADSNTLLGKSYILSTKDLNTIEHIGELQDIDSLKIEGRMKEPVYVANVVSRYRDALDHAGAADDALLLNRTFNRSFTRGYLFGEDRKDITNINKPNHNGYFIGTIAGKRKGMYELRLCETLNQNDVISIRRQNKCPQEANHQSSNQQSDDINLSVARLYDAEGKLINSASSCCFIKLREKLCIGDSVYKTKDRAFEKSLAARLSEPYRRFPLNFAVYAYPGAPLVVDAESEGMSCSYTSPEVLSEALKQPSTLEAVTKQLARLNDTLFSLGSVDYLDHNAFIPSKMLNTARKELVEALYAEKLARKPRRVRTSYRAYTDEQAGSQTCQYTAEHAHSTAQKQAGALCFPTKPAYLTAAVIDAKQYAACKAEGIETVYYQNIVPRNSNVYDKREGELLIGGLGGIEFYRNSNPFVSDYSLNVVNATSCFELHKLGAKRVTLSYEMNQQQIKDLIDAYRARFGGSPALEMIVYGHAPLLVTKYCPLKKLELCGTCKTKHYVIQDDFGSFPLLSHENCDTTVLNGRVLNLLDEMPHLDGIEAFRLNFTLESAAEIRSIIQQAKAALEGTQTSATFNPKTDTRGYFHAEIL